MILILQSTLEKQKLFILEFELIFEHIEDSSSAFDPETLNNLACRAENSIRRRPNGMGTTWAGSHDETRD